MLPIADRVVMVSGANRGIGLAIARCLHDKGYRLSLGARDLPALEAATRDMAPARRLCHAYEARDRAAAETWVGATVERFGAIDGLVNAAGILLPVTVEEDAEERFEALWQVNVMGPLRMTRLALPYLKASGHGRIVNVASLSGKRVKGTTAGYPMSKFAVMALSHATRQVGWAEGVRVTALCPGWVATDMAARAPVPRGEMIQPEDLAELVAVVLALPNNAAVAELPVNCALEDFF